jgi:hypothetical protein
MGGRAAVLDKASIMKAFKLRWTTIMTGLLSHAYGVCAQTSTAVQLD